jgi:mono/diheme cytochrome c family protein
MYITPVLLAQGTVYEFIARGVFEAHIGRLRETLKARRDALLAAFEADLRLGVVVLAVVVLAGCGGSSHGNARRDAVNAYFDRVDRAEAGLGGSSGEIDSAFRGFKLTGNSAIEVRELTFARDRIASALRRVQAIDPPAEARRLHADVVQLLLLQHAAAAELLAIVNYEPRFQGALGPLSAAGKALARDIREAARTKSPPASAGSNVAAATAWGQGRCGGCHTLAATASTGTTGPNLDVLQLTPAQIAAKIRSGGGACPPSGSASLRRGSTPWRRSSPRRRRALRRARLRSTPMRPPSTATRPRSSESWGSSSRSLPHPSSGRATGPS